MIQVVQVGTSEYCLTSLPVLPKTWILPNLIFEFDAFVISIIYTNEGYQDFGAFYYHRVNTFTGIFPFISQDLTLRLAVLLPSELVTINYTYQTNINFILIAIACLLKVERPHMKSCEQPHKVPVGQTEGQWFEIVCGYTSICQHISNSIIQGKNMAYSGGDNLQEDSVTHIIM